VVFSTTKGETDMAKKKKKRKSKLIRRWLSSHVHTILTRYEFLQGHPLHYWISLFPCSDSKQATAMPTYFPIHYSLTFNDSSPYGLGY